MMGFIIGIHILVCILLILIILVQAGRGGGLVESFSSVENMFGTKTNTFLTQATKVLAIMFFITCLTLAFMSSKMSRSLVSGTKIKPKAVKTVPLTAPALNQTTASSQTTAVNTPVTEQAATPVQNATTSK